MDAKITKSRLGNFLSYEWIKAVLVAALFAVLVVVIMISCGVRVQPGQRFSVMTYMDVWAGNDVQAFGENDTKAIFSHGILTGGAEALDTNNGYDVFPSRRAVGEGDVMFITHGYEDSSLQTLIDENRSDSMDPQLYLSKTEEYLKGFFGGDLTGGVLDTDRATQAFYARAEGDNRFRTDAQKAAGVLQEIARMNKLRDDYLFVKNCFADGTYSFTEITKEDGSKVVAAINLSSTKLARITSLAAYAKPDGEDSAVRTNEGLQLLIMNNEARDGDLFYETVSYLRYLVEHYGPQAV